MQFRIGRAFYAVLLSIGLAAALAACSGSSTSAGSPVPTPTPATSITFSVAAGGSTVLFPGGLNGSLQFQAATAGAGSNFTVAETNSSPPSGIPAFTAFQPQLYFTFMPAVNTTFTGFPALTFTFNAGFVTSGFQFFVAFFDPKNTAAGWQQKYVGPGVVNGQTVTFAAGTKPVTFNGGSTYGFVLYGVPTVGPTPTPVPPTSALYVTNNAPGNPNRNTVLIFPPTASGNVIPNGSISGPLTLLSLPNGLAFDSNSNLIVANGGGSIERFAPGAMGNVAPAARITGPSLVAPQFPAVDSKNNIYVTQNTATGSPADSVQSYAAASNGVKSPSTTISGAKTLLKTPMGIGLDSKDNIYVANNGSNAITIYAAGANGNVAPIGTIAGDKTTLSNPTGLALDSSGNILVANGNNSILIFAATTTGGNIAPTTTIAGNATLLNSPMELSLDLNGKMFVANNGVTGQGANSVLAFLLSASGNVLPAQDLNGPLTGLAQPFGVAAR
ncbi:MAG: hypothetical protein DLM50_04825 [Candidatus Meridianibacter frigidus]|nr:MAG: hypothetical protein DLM50_04825 [Candidatus Eremiobacteraeota bacterium]